MSAQTAGTYTTQQAKDHLLVPESTRAGLGNGVKFEKRPVKGSDGRSLASTMRGSFSTMRANLTPYGQKIETVENT